MARRLAQSGFSVTAWNRSLDKAKAHARREDHGCELAGYGLQSFSGLRRKADVGNACLVERGRRREDDRNADQVRKRHSNQRIGANATEGSRGLPRRPFQWSVGRLEFFFLNLLGSLPEEQ